MTPTISLAFTIDELQEMIADGYSIAIEYGGPPGDYVARLETALRELKIQEGVPL